MTDRNMVLFSLAVPTLLLAGGCNPTASQNISQNMECAPATWYGMELAEPGIFTVPTTVNGEAGDMQVDTGAGFTGLYGSAGDWPALDLQPAQGRTVILQGEPADIFKGAEISLGDTALVADPVVNFHTNAKDGIVGTIGMSSLWGRIVLIDPTTDRMCLLDGSDPLLDRTAFAPMRTDNGYLLLTLEAGGEEVGDVIFDTGSVFTSIVPGDLDAITDADADPMDVELSSWGELITLPGYPARGDISLSGVTSSQALELGTVLQEDNPVAEGTLGILGMSSFSQTPIILDLREARPRFGTLPR